MEGATVHALATPLITRPDGEKFGKSTGSTLWLDPALTTPFAFYQWFVNADDCGRGHVPARLQLPIRTRRSRRSRPRRGSVRTLVRRSERSPAR